MSLDDAAEELELLSADNPEIADREPARRCWSASTSAPNATTTTCARCSGRRTPIANAGRAARDPAPAGGRGREPAPTGLDRAAEALEQILRIEPRDADAFAALERIYRGADRPAALAAAMARRLEVTDTIEAKRELLSALAETYERELDEWEPALDAYKAAEAAGDARPETYAAIDRLAERLGRWDVAAEAARKWAETRAEDAGALAALARVRRHNGELEARAATCSSTPPNARRPARRRRRC